MKIEREDLIKKVDLILVRRQKDYQIPGFNGRVLSSTSEIESKYLPICYITTKILQEELDVANRVVITRTGHRYLKTENWLIEPTIGQFVLNHGRVFVGTELELKNLVRRSKLVNTKYDDDPEAALELVWGMV